MDCRPKNMQKNIFYYADGALIFMDAPRRKEDFST